MTLALAGGTGLIAGSSFAAPAKSAAPAKALVAKPNVILIMTDDQGYGDVSAHGNPILKTPNMDTLHSQSARFIDFHVCPFCAPTRASLMTGRFAERGNVWTTVYNRNHLDRREATMAEFFKASGYATGHFGKWHIGENYPYRAMDRGFDSWVGHGDGGLRTVSDYWANDRMNDHYMRDGKWEPFKGYCTDIFFDETMKFITANKEKPFFVYLATNIPHGPCHILPEWENPYKKIKGGNKACGTTGEFFRTIAQVDHNLGKLRKFLEANGLAENTILIFLTDNGSSQGSRIFNAGMRGHKGSTFDGGHRVPCFIHWPGGGLDKPRDIKDLTSCTDLLPTLKELCGLSDPARKLLPLDGKSLAPLLAGKPADWKDRAIILHQQNCTSKSTKWRNTVVLATRWRLINGKTLYDIKADPGQKKNVAKKHPTVVADLRKRYETYWKEINTNQQLKEPARAILGSSQQAEAGLNSYGAMRTTSKHIYDQRHVLAAVSGEGAWPVEVAKAGTYHFEVRRWPREVNKPITAPLAAQTQSDTILAGRPWHMPAGKAIPAVKVRLRVGKTIVEKAITGKDCFAAFDLKLPVGATDIEAWLVNKAGKAHFVYYVYVKPKS